MPGQPDARVAVGVIDAGLIDELRAQVPPTVSSKSYRPEQIVSAAFLDAVRDDRRDRAAVVPSGLASLAAACWSRRL